MTTGGASVYDVVGIGFGPSNLSLAVALDDFDRAGSRPLKVAFFESQPSFGWHRNMLLPSSKMQVSFLKDLATFRNPVSRFSFVSYLHSHGRLAQFVNNCDFFPTRVDFHGYLEWVAANFADYVEYGARITSVTPVRGPGPDDPVDRLRIHVSSGAGSTFVEARNVVMATGLAPKMPDGVVQDEHVWHSSEFLGKFRRSPASELRHVVVVGAGQSAAEIVRFCYDEAPNARITAVVPSYGYSIADNTPFANQVFDPDAVDDYYLSEQHAKDKLWQYHRNTNYSVVDGDVIRSLYQCKYDDDVRGVERLRFMELSRITAVKRSCDDTRITVQSLATGRSDDLDVDVVVCATGYEPMNGGGLLGDVDRYCLRDSQGRRLVERDYRLTTTKDLRCGIYLQGGTEHTHGLSSSLLSNLAVRSGEIAESISRNRLDEPSDQ
ncbi:lysine N(6)-hydroxylase/L-ornithine N(5)-oxygenase family protein [Streptomyces sp. PSAA01]|uniref:lysine N(6)-hydroxylase/L-ornithine N(5)-oxygenase family protein n=1 Tax=Streptomyces sp. PSAA01 TaxID=2912762 RepID=UPI001F3DE09D|nr:SidA/IucD/PvdA family monooxygenase [Streptomyces sp. PSAA01]MCG0284477.1 lysine N(6)-hydroxylase/L-ornithine N(5)-oxygenase family protein [Streptomyces sp. PSAA01]